MQSKLIGFLTWMICGGALMSLGGCSGGIGPESSLNSIQSHLRGSGMSFADYADLKFDPTCSEKNKTTKCFIEDGNLHGKIKNIYPYSKKRGKSRIIVYTEKNLRSLRQNDLVRLEQTCEKDYDGVYKVSSVETKRINFKRGKLVKNTKPLTYYGVVLEGNFAGNFCRGGIIRAVPRGKSTLRENEKGGLPCEDLGPGGEYLVKHHKSNKCFRVQEKTLTRDNTLYQENFKDAESSIRMTGPNLAKFNIDDWVLVKNTCPNSQYDGVYKVVNKNTYRLYLGMRVANIQGNRSCPSTKKIEVYKLVDPPIYYGILKCPATMNKSFSGSNPYKYNRHLLFGRSSSRGVVQSNCAELRYDLKVGGSVVHKSYTNYSGYYVVFEDDLPSGSGGGSHSVKFYPEGRDFIIQKHLSTGQLRELVVTNSLESIHKGYSSGGSHSSQYQMKFMLHYYLSLLFHYFKTKHIYFRALNYKYPYDHSLKFQFILSNLVHKHSSSAFAFYRAYFPLNYSFAAVQAVYHEFAHLLQTHYGPPISALSNKKPKTYFDESGNSTRSHVKETGHPFYCPRPEKLSLLEGQAEAFARIFRTAIGDINAYSPNYHSTTACRNRVTKTSTRRKYKEFVGQNIYEYLYYHIFDSSNVTLYTLQSHNRASNTYAGGAGGDEALPDFKNELNFSSHLTTLSKLTSGVLPHSDKLNIYHIAEQLNVGLSHTTRGYIHCFLKGIPGGKFKCRELTHRRFCSKEKRQCNTATIRNLNSSVWGF